MSHESWEDELRRGLAIRPWWRRLNPITVMRIDGHSFGMTIVQWRDVSATARPIFKKRYHYIDWLIQNHGWFAGWPIGFQVWR